MTRLLLIKSERAGAVAGIEFHLGDLLEIDRHVTLALGGIGIGGGERAIVGEHLLISGHGAGIVLGALLEIADLLERERDVLAPFGPGLLAGGEAAAEGKALLITGQRARGVAGPKLDRGDAFEKGRDVGQIIGLAVGLGEPPRQHQALLVGRERAGVVAITEHAVGHLAADVHALDIGGQRRRLVAGLVLEIADPFQRGGDLRLQR